MRQCKIYRREWWGSIRMLGTWLLHDLPCLHLFRAVFCAWLNSRQWRCLIVLFCISYIVASKCLLRMPPYRRLSAHKSSYRVRNHRSFQWYRYRLVCCRFFKGCISFSLIYCVILLQLWCILTTYNFHSINRRGWWIPARKRSQCRCILVAGKETISRRRICGKSILNLDF